MHRVLEVILLVSQNFPLSHAQYRDLLPEGNFGKSVSRSPLPQGLWNPTTRLRLPDVVECPGPLKRTFTKRLLFLSDSGKDHQ